MTSGPRRRGHRGRRTVVAVLIGASAWVIALVTWVRAQEKQQALEARCRAVERLAGKFVDQAPRWPDPIDIVQFERRRRPRQIRLGFPTAVRALEPEQRGPLLESAEYGPISWHVAYEELLLTRAYRALRAGKLDEADAVLHELNRLAHRWELAAYLSHRVRMARAQRALETGAYDQVEALASPLCESSFPDVRQLARRLRAIAWAHQAVDALDQGQLDRARDLLERALRMDPQAHAVREARGTLRRAARDALAQAAQAADNGQLLRAWSLLERAERLWPETPGLDSIRARLQYEPITALIEVPRLPDLGPLSCNRPIAYLDCLLRYLSERPLRRIRSLSYSEPGTAVDDWRLSPGGNTLLLWLAGNGSAGADSASAEVVANAVRHYVAQCNAHPVRVTATAANRLSLHVPMGPPLWYLPPWPSYAASVGGQSGHAAREQTGRHYLEVTFPKSGSIAGFRRAQLVATKGPLAEALQRLARGQRHVLIVSPTPRQVDPWGAVRRVPVQTPVTAFLAFNMARPAAAAPLVREIVAVRAQEAARRIAARYSGLRPVGRLFDLQLPHHRVAARSATPPRSLPVLAAHGPAETIRFGYPAWLAGDHIATLADALRRMAVADGLSIQPVPIARDQWQTASAECDLLYWEYSWSLGELPFLASIGRDAMPLYGLPPLGPAEDSYQQLAALVRTTRDPVLWQQAVGTLERLLTQHHYVVPLWTIQPRVYVWEPLLRSTAIASRGEPPSAEEFLESLPTLTLRSEATRRLSAQGQRPRND